MTEVYEAKSQGFQRLMTSEGWQIAMITYAPQYSAEGFHHMKRHKKTDEVFCLIQGSARLHTSDDGISIQTISVEPHKVYCIRKNTWHYLEISKDALLMVVENEIVLPEYSEQIEL